MTMRISIQAETDSEESDESLSLYHWLRRETLADITVEWSRPEVVPGHMGTLGEIIIIGVGSGGAITVLARSVSVWLQTRRADITLKIKHRGRSYEVNGRRVQDPTAIIREIVAAIKETDEGEPA
jgi:hypothetical protein